MSKRLHRTSGAEWSVQVGPWSNNEVVLNSPPYPYPTLDAAASYAASVNERTGRSVRVMNRFGKVVLYLPPDPEVRARTFDAYNYAPDGTGIHSAVKAYGHVVEERQQIAQERMGES